MLCLCYICINYYNYTTVLPPGKIYYSKSILLYKLANFESFAKYFIFLALSQQMVDF